MKAASGAQVENVEVKIEEKSIHHRKLRIVELEFEVANAKP